MQLTISRIRCAVRDKHPDEPEESYMQSSRVLGHAEATAIVRGYIIDFHRFVHGFYRMYRAAAPGTGCPHPSLCVFPPVHHTNKRSLHKGAAASDTTVVSAAVAKKGIPCRFTAKKGIPC